MVVEEGLVGLYSRINGQVDWGLYALNLAREREMQEGKWNDPEEIYREWVNHRRFPVQLPVQYNAVLMWLIVRLF